MDISNAKVCTIHYPIIIIEDEGCKVNINKAHIV
jgi:hypothetical protein